MKLVIAIVVILLIIGGGIGYILTRKKTATPNTASTSTSTASTNMNMSNSSTTQTATQTDKVTIQNFAFSPSSISVKKGTTVTWTNQDSTAHTVTSDNGTELASSQLSNGQSYSHTFTTTGTFSYHCSIHSTMTGSVTVTE